MFEEIKIPAYTDLLVWDLAFKIFSTCLQNNISLDIQWIPRDQNSKADYLSKIIDYEDWGVTKQFFDFINSMWGPHTIDRFASPLKVIPGEAGFRTDCFKI